MACAGVALRLCPQRGYAFNVFEPATLRVLAQGTLFPGAHLLGESWGLVEPAKTATCCIILSLQPWASQISFRYRFLWSDRLLDSADTSGFFWLLEYHQPARFSSNLSMYLICFSFASWPKGFIYEEERTKATQGKPSRCILNANKRWISHKAGCLSLMRREYVIHFTQRDWEHQTIIRIQGDNSEWGVDFLEIMFDIFWYPVSLTNRPCPSNSEKSHVESRGTQHLFGQWDERCCFFSRSACQLSHNSRSFLKHFSIFFLFPSFFLRVSWTLAALAVSFNISQAGAQSRRSSGLAEGTQAWNLGGPSGTQRIAILPAWCLILGQEFPTKMSPRCTLGGSSVVFEVLGFLGQNGLDLAGQQTMVVEPSWIKNRV